MEPIYDPNISATSAGSNFSHSGGPLSRPWSQPSKRRRKGSPGRDRRQEQAQHLLRQHQQRPYSQHHDRQISTNETLFDANNTIPPLIRIPLPRPGGAGWPTSSDSALALLPLTSTPASIGLSTTSSISCTRLNPASPGSPQTVPNQASLLASKSNYEWIASGRHEEMGLHFSTAMTTGVVSRRSTHRAAEQARRDRMKGAMEDLAEYVLGGEVEFGSGTSCFIVAMKYGEGETEEGLGNEDEVLEDCGAAKGKGKKAKGRNINKARVIEIALEKLKRQDKEIAVMEERLRAYDYGDGRQVRRQVE